MISTNERREQIATALLASGKIKVGETARQFNVSAETIRKDLICLERQGIARKKHGGAVVMGESIENNFNQKSAQHEYQKMCIAVEAAKLVPEGATVTMDSGSTILHLARQLVLRSDIIVITNFVPIIQLFQETQVKVIAVGGEVRSVSQSMVGMIAEGSLTQLCTDISFIATSGFLGRKGPCVESLPEAKIKKLMIENSVSSYLLCDSSKQECNAMVEFAQWKDFTGMVTDEGISPTVRGDLAKYTEMIIAPKLLAE